MRARNSSIAALMLALAALPAVANQDRVAARVNGVPITQAQVEAGVPADAYARRAKVIRETRLKRLIDQLSLRQFLTARGVKVPERLVDQRIAKLRKYPPSVGCPCCRFADLEQYLRVDSITMPELRAQVRNEIGLDTYLGRLWEPERRKLPRAVSEGEQQRLSRTYARAWHIFFNTFQIIEGADPGTMRQQAKSSSDRAWLRVRSGEPFAKVAREMSEDRASGDLGGTMGLIKPLLYGRDFDETLRKLKPGVVHPPFKSGYGYHIARWQPVTAADYPALYRMEFFERKKAELMAKVRATAKVERL